MRKTHRPQRTDFEDGEEKAPKPRIVGYQTYCLTCNSHVTAKECDCVGFNQEMQEFLNNLDTI